MEMESQLQGEPPFRIKLTLSVRKLMSDSKQCSMLANYIAGYAAYQYQAQERGENLISTITNEVLESVSMLVPKNSELVLMLNQSELGLYLYASHAIDPNLSGIYKDFVQKLSNPISDEEYFQMFTSEKPLDVNFNQLGLMMISHDFGINFVKCDNSRADRISVQLLIGNEELQS